MNAIQKIRDEHRSISAVLHALKQLARYAQDARVKPDFAVFRAILHYIDKFPEALHHPKEERYLFPPLAALAPEVKKTLDALREEHKEGERLVRELERALVLFEDTWPAGGAGFLRQVDKYVDFHRRHMLKEEHEILPAAQRHFTPGDWAPIDEAFAANEDPIAGVQEHDFEALFTRIVNLAPAPVGFGEPWRNLAMH